MAIRAESPRSGSRRATRALSTESPSRGASSTSLAGRNFWANYGTAADPYGVLPYNDSGLITVGGDYYLLTPPLYNVTFTEKGLPRATLWSVTLDGITFNSSSSSITFLDPNGSYAYSVPAAGGRLNGGRNCCSRARDCRSFSTTAPPQTPGESFRRALGTGIRASGAIAPGSRSSDRAPDRRPIATLAQGNARCSAG